LEEHGISCEGKRARVITRDDYHYYDQIVVMDSENIQSLRWLFGKDKDRKVKLLMDYTDRPGEVADPWYTGDFEATWQDVSEGCKSLLNTYK
jgi:protein-tyrosine phosphatase